MTPGSFREAVLPTSPQARGACHLRATFHRPELNGDIATNTCQGKAALLIDYEDRLSIMDSLILCRFYRDLYPWEMLCDIVHRVTGLMMDKASLQQRAKDVITLVRRLNLREGARTGRMIGCLLGLLKGPSTPNGRG